MSQVPPPPFMQHIQRADGSMNNGWSRWLQLLWQHVGVVGYAAGQGSGVTQITSRSTPVVINAPCGQITLVAAAGTPSAPTSFIVLNSTVASTDTVVLSQQSGTNQYVLLASAVAAGQFTITFWTAPGQTATDAPVLNFAVVKSVPN